MRATATIADGDGGRKRAASTGLISNPRSHLNRAGRAAVEGHPGVLARAPRTREALQAAMAEFAAAGIDLLIIDGGDGTVRDVLTSAGDLWDGRPWPRIAIVPSGKTNALAIDLGLPADWTRERAIAAAQGGTGVKRDVLEIVRHGDPRTPLRGFLLGAGAFVRATQLAQRAHRWGAYQGVAVGITIAWGVATTLIGRGGRAWRSGEPMPLTGAGTADGAHARYLLLATTLERLPAGLKVFGALTRGLKLLAIDAPPRRIVRAAAAIVRGSEAAWLARAGYHRVLVDEVELSVEQGFILDGELHRGGTVTLRRGLELIFVVP